MHPDLQRTVLPHQVAYTTHAFDEPWTMESYERVGGWQAWRGIVARRPDPAELVETIKHSALRGRGGAGFGTGLKLSFMPRDDDGQKYVLCNSDEAEPGTIVQEMQAGYTIKERLLRPALVGVARKP